MEISRSFGIIRSLIGIHMLGAIQFDDQSGFVAVKIGNIVPDNLLPSEPRGTITEKVIPKVSFFFRHIFTQFTGEGGNAFVSGFAHASNMKYDDFILSDMEEYLHIKQKVEEIKRTNK